MQTPKGSKKGSSEVPRKLSPRAISSEVPQKISPRAVSSEVSQKISPRAVSSEMPRKISPRAVSSEVPQKISPRAVRKLNTTGLESDSASSSNQNSRTLKKTSPKVAERRSPRSPVSEIQKRRVSKVAVLESQISQLQDDLKGVKDQLSSSNSCKNQAEQEAEESKKQLVVVSSKLKESQQLLALYSSEDSLVIKTENLSQERDRARQSELVAMQKQHSLESSALASSTNGIKELKAQIEMVAESEAKQTKQAESANAELHNLKESLAETNLLVEDMKNQITKCKESEAKANALADETLLQLETAKKTVDTLRMDGAKATEAYNTIAFELDQLRAHAFLLEGLFNKLKADTDDKKSEDGIGENVKNWESIEAEVRLVKNEFGQLSSALEAAEVRYHEEQIQSTVEITSAYELVEEMKSKSSLREAGLESEINTAKANVEELKANLTDKETELQGVYETRSNERESELENELKKTKEEIENLKANIMEKETEFHNILDVNGTLKWELKKNEANDKVFTQLEAARAAEEQARVRLSYVVDEAEKSNKRETCVAEQLEAAQAANVEMEAELRRLRVQSDQWRKAAEVAAAMLSTGNNGKFVERTGSMDSSYNPVTGKIGSPYFDEMDDDFGKKKNGNVLKRIGILWKKQQK